MVKFLWNSEFSELLYILWIFCILRISKFSEIQYILFLSCRNLQLLDFVSFLADIIKGSSSLTTNYANIFPYEYLWCTNMLCKKWKITRSSVSLIYLQIYSFLQNIFMISILNNITWIWRLILKFDRSH